MNKLEPLQRYGTFNNWYAVEDVQAREKMLVEALELIYDRWENGINVLECDSDGYASGGNIGKAVDLSEEEEKQILSILAQIDAEKGGAK